MNILSMICNRVIDKPFFFDVSLKCSVHCLKHIKSFFFCNCTCMIFIRTRTKTHGVRELQSKWSCEIKLSLKLAATYQEMVRDALRIRKWFQVFFLPLESEKILPVNRLRSKGNYSLISKFLPSL